VSLHVVLAEDDPDIRLVARLALKKAGYRVTAVTNGRELLEKVAEERPDVVRLDWMMPEMDGAEACVRLRADPATADLPIIFMTAKSQGFEVQRGLALKDGEAAQRGFIITGREDFLEPLRRGIPTVREKLRAVKTFGLAPSTDLDRLERLVETFSFILPVAEANAAVQP
jgi:CheY-like chemotaxis protein